MSLSVHSSRPFIVVVDGIIGAGKSTLISKCLLPHLKKKGLPVTLVNEPVERWKSSGALKQFYTDPSRRAYQFQTRVFHDRMKEMLTQWDCYSKTSKVFVLERSIFTDQIFMEMLYEDGHVDKSEMEDYRDLWSMWERLMPAKPDLFLYLRPDLDQAMERLKKRARPGEELVSRDYQVALLEKHDAFLGQLGSDGAPSVEIGGIKIPVMTLCTNDNFADSVEVQERIGDQVYNYLKVALEMTPHN